MGFWNHKVVKKYSESVRQYADKLYGYLRDEHINRRSKKKTFPHNDDLSISIAPPDVREHIGGNEIVRIGLLSSMNTCGYNNITDVGRLEVLKAHRRFVLRRGLKKSFWWVVVFVATSGVGTLLWRWL